MFPYTSGQTGKFQPVAKRLQPKENYSTVQCLQLRRCNCNCYARPSRDFRVSLMSYGSRAVAVVWQL